MRAFHFPFSFQGEAFSAHKIKVKHLGRSLLVAFMEFGL